MPRLIDASSADRRIGTRLGKYRITARLGQGGMGIVYAAADTLLQRAVALKLLPDSTACDPATLQRFLREAQAAARLSHPNVVAIYEVGRVADVRYLAMELVHGDSVQAFLRACGPFDWCEATRIAVEVCRGLTAAHESGLIHRDIKPANVMLSRDGMVKLADFGLAKSADQSLASSASFVAGTPDFMSPEQCRNDELDECSDIYSLGATYYAMLTGRPPFSATAPVQVMFAHCTKEVPDPRQFVPSIPEACTAIVHRAMAKDGSRRFGSAAETAAALEAVLEAHGRIEDAAERRTYLTDRPPPDEVLSEAQRWLEASTAGHSRVRRYRWAAIATILACFCGVATWLRSADPAAAPSVQLAATGESASRVAAQERASLPPVLSVFQLDSPGTLLAASRDEQWLAVGGEEGDVGFKLWNLSTGELLPERRFRLPRGRTHQQVTALAFAPDGARLAVAVRYAEGGELAIWDMQHDAHPARLLALGSSVASALDFSPDGAMLAAACNDDATVAANLRTWNCNTWLESDEIRLNAFPATWLSYSAAEPRRLALAVGEQVLLRGLASSSAVNVLESSHWKTHGVFASRCDLLAVVAMNYVRLRRIDESAEPQLRELPSGTAECVAVSPDGAWVAVGGGTEHGGLITLLDTADEHAPLVLRGHSERVCAAAFLPQRGLLVSTGRDRTVRFWPLPEFSSADR